MQMKGVAVFLENLWKIQRNPEPISPSSLCFIQPQDLHGLEPTLFLTFNLHRPVHTQARTQGPGPFCGLCSPLKPT